MAQGVSRVWRSQNQWGCVAFPLTIITQKTPCPARAGHGGVRGARVRRGAGACGVCGDSHRPSSPVKPPAPHAQGMEAYGVRAFAEALEVVPSTLAENAGLNPIEICTQLRGRPRARRDRRRHQRAQGAQAPGTLFRVP